MNFNQKSIPKRKVQMVSLITVCMAMSMFLVPVSAQENKVTDQNITDRVQDELFYDQAVNHQKFDIETTDGIVTLSGEVNNLLEKERSEKIAETVKGVRSVVNTITVSPPAFRTNSEIQDDVEQALFEDPATNTFEVEAEVEDNGVVTLTGSVESMQEKSLAGTVAKGVRGVTKVKNEITVDYDTERPDYEIKEDIEQTLKWNSLVDDALITVTVNNGKVTLKGIAGSAAEKREAINAAWVAGVYSVDSSGLEVKRWARDEDLREGKYVYKSDTELESAVEDAMLFDPRVNSFDIKVEVENGIVTLRGEVDNLKAKRAATKDAKNTVGVISVENRVKVRPEETLRDKQIENKLHTSLMRDPYVERYEINVDVINGVAHLYGQVDTYFEKAQAEDVASRVVGVVSVNNNLIVEEDLEPYVYEPYTGGVDIYDYDWYDYQPNRTYLSDLEIKSEIKDELWWSPFVDANDVNVTVDEGVASLSGTVDSWSEYHAARENAYEGGATWVENDLNVE